jgi:hypothetical protein
LTKSIEETKLSKFKNDLMEKIESRMQKLEEQLKSQAHISDPDGVMETIVSITKFWNVINEDDRDYIGCARYALENSIEWK